MRIIYKCEDGTEFLDEVEALAYEARVAKSDILEAYILTNDKWDVYVDSCDTAKMIAMHYPKIKEIMESV
jgi:uncharacterized protein YktA (UPF0223 family)